MKRPDRAAIVRELSGFNHPTYRVNRWDAAGYGIDEPPEDRVECGLDEADVISSRITGSSRHTVMLDLDVPARLVPSSTPGHSHLYIDRAMAWPEYEQLLKALAAAGVLEPGYVDASIERKHTALRLPWVKKDDRARLLTSSEQVS